MAFILRYAVLIIGGLTFALGFVTAAEGRTAKVSDSVSLATVDQTEKLASAAYMLAGAILLASGVLACHLDTTRNVKP
jgi:hypothetical protein